MKKLLLILLCIPMIGFGQDDCGNEPKYTGFKFGNYKTSTKYIQYIKEFEKWQNCKELKKNSEGLIITLLVILI